MASPRLQRTRRRERGRRTRRRARGGHRPRIAPRVARRCRERLLVDTRCLAAPAVQVPWLGRAERVGDEPTGSDGHLSIDLGAAAGLVSDAATAHLGADVHNDAGRLHRPLSGALLGGAA